MAKGGRDRMTADDERRFFSLLRAGLWDKDVELCLFGSPVDWQSLLEQGRKQTVLGVLADGIGKLPPALRPPFPIHRSLQQELLHIRQGHILLTGNLGKTGLCRHPSRSAEGTRYGTILCLPRTAAVWGYRPLCRTGTVRSCLSGAQKIRKAYR